MKKTILSLVFLAVWTVVTHAQIVITGTTFTSSGTTIGGTTGDPVYTNLPAPSQLKLADLAVNGGVQLAFDVRFSTLDNQSITTSNGFSFGFVGASSSVAYAWQLMNTGTGTVKILDRDTVNLTDLGGTTLYGSDNSFAPIVTNSVYHYEFTVTRQDSNTYTINFQSFLDGTLVDSYETDADLRYIGNSITRLGFRQYSALNLTGGTAITNLNLYSTTMIPEPGTYALLGLGCGIGLFLLMVKRRRQNT